MKIRILLFAFILIIGAAVIGPWISPYGVSEVSSARLASPTFAN